MPFQETNVLTKPLFGEPFYVLMPADHPWIAKASIDSELLNSRSLFLLDEGHRLRDQVLEVHPIVREGDENKHAMVESLSLETIRHMVTSGLDVSALPFSTVNSHYCAPDVIEVRPSSAPVSFHTVAIT